MEEFFALPRRLPIALLVFLGTACPLPSAVSASPPSAAGRASSDPFVSGLRWSHGAPAATPWIPRDLVLVGDGELLWAAPAGATPSLALFGTASVTDPVAPLFGDPGFAGAIGPLHVATGDSADELFALAQYDTTTPPLRRTVVTRHDAVASAGGAAFVPLWSTELGRLGNGGAMLAATPTGDTLVAACFAAGSSVVRVERLDPRNGVPLAVAEFFGLALRGLAIAADGERLVVLVGTEALVLDRDLVVLHGMPLASAGAGVSLAASGRRIAVTDGSELLVLEESGGTWTSRVLSRGGPAELAVQTALSTDGAVLAVTWWNAANGTDVRCEILDGTTGGVLGGWSQTGTTGGLQNFPSALALTPDGRRVALGLWGTGDGRPEVVLLEVGKSSPVLEADLPGSVEALALDPGGTRIAVGMKDAHANHFATTGAVRLYDTGERDLQLTAVPRLGGRLELGHGGSPAGTVVFAVGTPRAAPLSVPFLGGELWLDTAHPLLLFAVAPDPLGRAWWALDVPADAALAGLEVVVQAVVLPAGGGVRLARRVVRPALL